MGVHSKRLTVETLCHGGNIIHRHEDIVNSCMKVQAKFYLTINPHYAIIKSS